MFVGLLVRQPIAENSPIVYLAADYVFTADDGLHSFAAHVEGTENLLTDEAVLNGVVTDGWLEGARVQDQFDILGGGHFQGTFRIMTGSAN